MAKSRLPVPVVPVVAWVPPQIRKCPAAIRTLADGPVRARAKELWAAAARLETALEVAFALPWWANAGLSISDTVQADVTTAVPELRDLKALLDCLAVWPTPGKPYLAPPPGVPFPAVAFEGLKAALACVIRRDAEILEVAGAIPRQRSRRGRPFWEHVCFIAVTGRPNGTPVQPAAPCVSLRRPHPQMILLASPYSRGLGRVQDDARQFRESIAVAPLTALSASSADPLRQGPACRLLADVTRGFVVLRGRAIEVTTPGAALVQVLVNANGDWISGREACQMHSELTGSRADRVFHGLPADIRAEFEVSRSKGFRLRPVTSA